MRCERCGDERLVKAGRDRARRQIWYCATCSRRRTERSGSSSGGYRFPDEVIALAVGDSLW